MGQSISATLFFGLVFEEEGCVPWRKRNDDGDFISDADEDWEEVYADACGLPRPTRPYPGDKEPIPEEVRREIQKEYSDYRDAKRKIIEKCSISIDWYIDLEFPLYYVAIKSSVLTAYDTAMQVKPELLKSGDEWDQQLIDFCRKMKIEVPDEVNAVWWIVNSRS